MEMLVFNMWGELIYKTDDLNTKGWDGRIENGLSPAGNYVYRLNMESIDGEQVIETGNFILIR
jgi:gliding motility-associated-like protein